MYRIQLIVLLFWACLSGCSKPANDMTLVNAQEVKDDALINKYLTDNNIHASVIDSAGVATGIYYTKDSLGSGNTLYTSSTTVTLSYTGWLMTTNATRGPAIGSSGQLFHPAFVLGEVMRGWQLGFELQNSQNSPPIGVGGAITLYIPSKYAYGPYPQPTLGLPANAVLIFHIIVYNVTN